MKNPGKAELGGVADGHRKRFRRLAYPAKGTNPHACIVLQEGERLLKPAGNSTGLLPTARLRDDREEVEGMATEGRTTGLGYGEEDEAVACDCNSSTAASSRRTRARKLHHLVVKKQGALRRFPTEPAQAPDDLPSRRLFRSRAPSGGPAESGIAGSDFSRARYQGETLSSCRQGGAPPPA